MHIIRLWLQVREVGARADIDQDLGPLSARCRGRALGHRQEVHQLVTEFDRGPDQGGAMGRIKTRCNSLGVDRVQLALGAQNHSTGQS